MKYLALALLILAASWGYYQSSQDPQWVHNWPLVQSDDETGLRPVDCWFGADTGLAPVECYRMQVREHHSKANSRFISFPVMVFRQTMLSESRSPLLHLGAGGPGAPMALDNRYAMEDLLQTMRQASLSQGRDLFVIDPRGTGLARPLLGCQTFIDGERKRFLQNLSLRQTEESISADYRECIELLLLDGVDFSAYNSFMIARDVEALRQAADIDQWVLFGVSYAANYALAIANEFPDAVESMVLDSAYVSRVGRHEYYLEQMTRPYRLLFRYCSIDPECEQPVDNIGPRFWAVYQSLNANPIGIELNSRSDNIPLLLNGERFLEVIQGGSYSLDIYKDIARIVGELENREYSSLEPYLWMHVDYMLDPTWGDVGAMAHYCYEEKSNIDFATIRTLIKQLPEGYLRDTAAIKLDWPDLCAEMKVVETTKRLIPSRALDQPTLFLHGKLDTVTPLSSVHKIRRYFNRDYLLTFDLAHSILSASRCARDTMAKFVDKPSASEKSLRCD